jgi:hypothetical protein
MDMLAQRRRKQFEKLLTELAPITIPVDISCEIHLLCNQINIDMGMWATWSFKRFLTNYRLYVHSDGTIEDDNVIKKGKR